MARGETSPWGNVCPLLKIARYYKVPYAVVLYLADYGLHGREVPGDITTVKLFASVRLDTYRMVMQDVRWWCAHMTYIRAGLVSAF